MKLEKGKTFYVAGKKVKGEVPDALIVPKSKDAKKKPGGSKGANKGSGKP